MSNAARRAPLVPVIALLFLTSVSTGLTGSADAIEGTRIVRIAYPDSPDLSNCLYSAIGDRCFDVRPGESRVRIAIEDDHLAHVAAWWQTDNATYSGTSLGAFCDAVVIDLPPGTTTVRISFDSYAGALAAASLGECGTYIASRGIVEATFTASAADPADRVLYYGADGNPASETPQPQSALRELDRQVERSNGAFSQWTPTLAEDLLFPFGTTFLLHLEDRSTVAANGPLTTSVRITLRNETGALVLNESGSPHVLAGGIVTASSGGAEFANVPFALAPPGPLEVRDGAIIVPAGHQLVIEHTLRSLSLPDAPVPPHLGQSLEGPPLVEATFLVRGEIDPSRLEIRTG